MTSEADNYEKWIKRFHPSLAGGIRLICLPHAGGSASGYFKLSAALAPSVEVWSVQYPGRHERRREQPLDDVRALARGVAQALRGRLTEPYALFGHSMGALVAYELALLLEGEGNGPATLIASGRRGPSTVRDERVHLSSDAEVAQELRGLSGTDPAFLQDPELFDMILPILRADYRAIETYTSTPGSAVKCPVSVLVGDSDPKTTIEEARAWSLHTTGEFDLRILPGGHFLMDECLSGVVNTISDITLPICVENRPQPHTTHARTRQL
ncbi:thioesterase II family protein [Streptomyces sp. NBC_00893]|uniref:thioesterase II family protein n=1 Tax=Streptomyces sp. NBC_00893 TaxID=2975862 RepID=UPI0022520F28|nr:alpha/beta fold hydrolase [Streptomyces sp. NBC_00893]MCX4851555.1 alpha/beta fold hydrolase [Streptomyces sp. NBC_00893]